MGRNSTPLIVILSAERAELSASENQDRTTRLAGLLMDQYGYARVLEGCYKGVKETSFIVDIYTVDKLGILKEIAFGVFGQESILILNTDSSPSLEFADGSSEHLKGKFQRVESVEGLDSWTRDPSNGKYYAIV